MVKLNASAQMRCLHTVLLTVFYLIGTRTAQGAVRVGAASCMQRIAPLAKDVSSVQMSPSAQLQIARNEYEAFQIVILADKQQLRNVSATITDLRLTGSNPRSVSSRIPARQISIRKVEYISTRYKPIPPEWNAFSHQDPSATSGQPSSWPDPLREIEKPFTIDAGAAQPLWIEVHVPTATPAGTYRGEVRIKADGQALSIIPLQVQVWDFELPRQSHLRSAFYIWDTSLVQFYGLANFRDPRFREIRRKYVDFYLKHRVSPFFPSIYSTDMKFVRRMNGEIDIDFTEFDRQMQHAMDLGLTAFQWPGHMLLYPERQSMYTGGPYIWDEREQKYVWVEMNENWAKPDQQQRKLSESLSRKIAEHLQKKGWLDKSVAYMVGEPRKGADEHVHGLDDYEYARQIFSWLHTLNPGIRTLTAMNNDQYAPEIAADVDIWAVDASNAWKFTERAQVERDKQRELWMYSPGNYRIDNLAAAYRIGPWSCFKYGWQGFGPFTDATAWFTAGTSRDPLSLESHGPESTPDDWIVYPDKDGPLETIRFQLLRDGMEDYEYLWLLRELRDKLRKVAPQSVLIPQAQRLLAQDSLFQDPDLFKKGGWDYSEKGILAERQKIGNLCQSISQTLNKIN